MPFEFYPSIRRSQVRHKEEMYDVGYRKPRFHLTVCTIITSLVLIVSGIILIAMRNITYENLINEALVLAPGRKSYEIFKKTPFDIYFDVYFFNWTNPEEFHNLNKKPVLQEIGPFRFLEVVEKTNITFHENNTVSFNRNRKWYFVKDQSPYDLNTPITTINPVAVSGAYTERYDSYFMKKGFSMVLSSSEGRIDITKSAGDMFFYGYEDSLINIAKKMPFVRNKLPPMDKFAWFYKRNGSNTFDGHFNMGTGPNSERGQILNWNYLNYTSYYPGECGHIRGVAAEFYPQNLEKKPLELFNSEMCRTLVMDYVGETSSNLIKGYEYTLGDHFLDNGTIIPGNECYCTGDCVPYGLMNVSTCRYGSPGFVSLPHFYKADPYYSNLVEGLTPRERHNFYLIVEPITGIPLEVAARLQLNLMVKNYPEISLLEDINDVFFPMLWFEQVVKIPLSHSLALLMLLWLREIFLFMGILFILTGTTMIFYITYRFCTTPIFSSKKNFIVKELVPLNQEKRR